MTTRETSHQPKFPVVVPGVGPIPAPGMIIGEAPGRKEIEEGKPFVGSSGKLLKQTLIEFGSDYGLDYYITNVFKGDVGEGNPTPTKEQIRDHQDILWDEIRRCNPSGILLLGAVAVRFFLGDDVRIKDVVGKRLAWEKYQVYPCYHPAYTMYNRESLEDFRYAVARFVLTTEVLSRYERVSS